MAFDKNILTSVQTHAMPNDGPCDLHATLPSELQLLAAPSDYYSILFYQIIAAQNVLEGSRAFTNKAMFWWSWP